MRIVRRARRAAHALCSTACSSRPSIRALFMATPIIEPPCLVGGHFIVRLIAPGEDDERCPRPEKAEPDQPPDMPDQRKAERGCENGDDDPRRRITWHVERFVIGAFAQLSLAARLHLQPPIGLVVGDVGQGGEVECGRGRCRDPFEAAPVPRIAAIVDEPLTVADRDVELTDLATDAARDQYRPARGNQEPGMPAGHVIMLQPPASSPSAQGHRAA